MLFAAGTAAEIVSADHPVAPAGRRDVTPCLLQGTRQTGTLAPGPRTLHTRSWDGPQPLDVSDIVGLCRFQARICLYRYQQQHGPHTYPMARYLAHRAPQSADRCSPLASNLEAIAWRRTFLPFCPVCRHSGCNHNSQHRSPLLACPCPRCQTTIAVCTKVLTADPLVLPIASLNPPARLPDLT
jgi:hypothetical protein